MTVDTSLGYVVASKFSIDPEKYFQNVKMKIAVQKVGTMKYQKNMLTKTQNQQLEKMILKARRVLKEKLRAKNFRKNYKQRGAIKR